MQRRHLAAGIALWPLAATAQPAQPPTPRVTIPGAPSAAPQPGAPQPGASQPGAGSEPWREALSAGILALVTSQLAVSKAQNDLLKNFAGFEVAEQRSVVQAMQIAGLPVPSQLRVEGEDARVMQQLEAASGAEFDRLYLRAQITGHQELLRLHNGMKAGGTREQKIISTLAAVTAEQHLRILQAIRIVRPEAARPPPAPRRRGRRRCPGPGRPRPALAAPAWRTGSPSGWAA